MNNTFNKRLLIVLLTMSGLLQATAVLTQPSTFSTFTKLSETHHATVYTDTQRSDHRLIVSKNLHTDISSAYAHICFAARTIPTDFTVFIDPSVLPQECSLCKKIDLHLDALHAHVAIGQGSRPVPDNGPCVFCEIVKGKSAPGIKKDGHKISESETALLFTKSKDPRILNNCLAITKSHILNIKDMTASDIPLVEDVFTLIRETMAKNNVRYVLFANNGAHPPSYQSVPHMHFHIESPDDCRFIQNRSGWITTQ